MSEWRGLHNQTKHVLRDRVLHDGKELVKTADCDMCDMWCFDGDPCFCCLQAEFAKVTAERDELRAQVQRVRELRQKWRHDVIATLGKALPGGVLSVPLNAVESQLGRALDGESDE